MMENKWARDVLGLLLAEAALSTELLPHLVEQIGVEPMTGDNP